MHLVKCVDYFFVKYAPTDANRKRIGPFTMIPLTLERKRMEDEWEDAMSPLFSQYVSIFEAEYDRYGNKGCRIFKGGILFHISDRFLAKNQHTKRKILCFMNRRSGDLSKIGHHFRKSSDLKIGVIKKCQ